MRGKRVRPWSKLIYCPRPPNISQNSLDKSLNQGLYFLLFRLFMYFHARYTYCYLYLLDCSLLSAYICMSVLLSPTGRLFAGHERYNTNPQDYFSFFFVPCTIRNISVMNKAIYFLPLCNCFFSPNFISFLV